jgi:hypothetical protein
MTWLAFWIVFHIVAQVVGLVIIARRRDTMKKRLVIKWTLLIIFLPIAGFLGFYFYLLEAGIQRGTPGRQDESAAFLRSPYRDR